MLFIISMKIITIPLHNINLDTMYSSIAKINGFRYIISICEGGHIVRFRTREKLNDREGQTDSTCVDKYYLTLTTKTFDVTLNFNYRGLKCLLDDYYRYTLIAPLFNINSPCLEAACVREQQGNECRKCKWYEYI